MWLFFLQDAWNPPGWGRRSILLCQSSSSSPEKLLTCWTSGSLLCFILKVKVKVESDSLRHGGLVHRILQARILEWVAFPISRGSSQPWVPHCSRVLYQLCHKGSPRILEWVACPFSKESSRPRNQTGVSCIVGRFFTNLAIREALYYPLRFFSLNVFLVTDRLINMELKLSSDWALVSL